MNVLIRVDNSPSVGLGHFMRCMSLAYELKAQGHNVSLATSRTSTINDMARKTYKKITIVEKEWDIDCELQIFKQLTEEASIDVIIVDTYKAKQDYYRAVSKYGRTLVVFDDINNPNLYFDILINGNIYAKKIPYKKHAEENLLLLGPEYLILRPDFKNLKVKDIPKTVKRVLITFGGSDPLNFTPVILETIIENINDYKDLEFVVIAGPGFKNIEQIEKKIAVQKNIKLVIDPKNILEIMRTADIAVSAAGSTTYELACLGIPSIIFVVADNQKLLAKEMGDTGLAINGGSITAYNKGDFMTSLNELITNNTLREDIYKKIIKTFDSFGAKRCVEEIKNFKRRVNNE